MKFWSLHSVLALSLLTLSAPVLAHDRPAPTTPGEYRNWGGEIDKLEIVSPFRLSSYHQIVVEPLDTSSTPLPDARDAAYKPTEEVLSQATTPFLFGLKEVLPKVPAQVAGPGVSPDPGTLVVRCKVLTLDPGKQAPRYSATNPDRPHAVIMGEVVDGGTGKTLFRFRQERRFSSNADMSFAGHHTPEEHVRLAMKPLPAAEEHKRDLGISLRLIGQDLGDILRTF
jgi:hypothetical protein